MEVGRSGVMLLSTTPLRPQDTSAGRAERIIRRMDELYRSQTSEVLI